MYNNRKIKLLRKLRSYIINHIHITNTGINRKIRIHPPLRALRRQKLRTRKHTIDISTKTLMERPPLPSGGTQRTHGTPLSS